MVYSYPLLGKEFLVRGRGEIRDAAIYPHSIPHSEAEGHWFERSIALHSTATVLNALAKSDFWASVCQMFGTGSWIRLRLK